MDFPNPRDESFQAEAEGRDLRYDSSRGFGKSISDLASVRQCYIAFLVESIFRKIGYYNTLFFTVFPIKRYLPQRSHNYESN